MWLQRRRGNDCSGRSPRLVEINAELQALSGFHEKPAGTIRITAGDHSTETILWPKLAKFLPSYPDIKVENALDQGLTDVVEQRFDAGVRLGEHLAKDRIAVRVGPNIRFAVVGSPTYLATRPAPTAPQELIAHAGINLCLPMLSGLYAWEFEQDDRELSGRVDGQLVFNSIFQVLTAALDGFGLAFVSEDLAQPHLTTGRLDRVLGAWTSPRSRYHQYYPSRRQPSTAFTLLVEALRYRGPN